MVGRMKGAIELRGGKELKRKRGKGEKEGDGN